MATHLRPHVISATLTALLLGFMCAPAAAQDDPFGDRDAAQVGPATADPPAEASGKDAWQKEGEGDWEEEGWDDEGGWDDEEAAQEEAAVVDDGWLPDRVIAFGMGGLFGFPTGDYAEQLDEWAGGLRVYLFVGVPRTGLLFGVDFGYAWFLHESYDLGTAYLSGSSLTNSVELRNSTWMLHGVARFQPRLGRLRPYVEGLLGMRGVTISADLREETTRTPCPSSDDDSCTTTEDTTLFDASDTVLSAGVGVGVGVALFDDPTSGLALLMTIGARSLWGGEATYHPSEAVGYDPVAQRVSFDRAQARTSATPMITVDMGFEMQF